MPIYCPNNPKYIKIFRRRRTNYSISNSFSCADSLIVKSQDVSRINYPCFLAFMAAVNKVLKGQGRSTHSPVTFDFFKTKKSIGSRMGGGKGGRDGQSAQVFKGSVLLFINGVTFEQAKLAIEKAKHKLPIKVKLFERNCYA